MKPIDKQILKTAMQEVGVHDLGMAAIREIVALVKNLESKTGVEFIRMDMGIPGLHTPELGVKAEIQALKNGVSSIYPTMDGIAELKAEVSKFAKNFIGFDIRPESCIVTTGSMQGAMAAFMIAGRREKHRNKVLFIDPGFPVQKKQVNSLGLEMESFDIGSYRGGKLIAKLESICQSGEISTLIYSNPNNPAWFCLTEEELQAIAHVVNKYDVVAIEDLAYFGMDFRHDYSQPGKEPFQPSISRYTDKFIILLSSSKVFSYAGQRVSCMLISDALYDSEFPDLLRFGGNKKLGRAMVYDGIYILSAGVSHSAQFGLTAMLKAANEGEFQFLEGVKEYEARAKELKKIFLDNGFELVYAFDGKMPVADGFYFTVKFPGMAAGDLIGELMCFGISTISLIITGSDSLEGIRISVSLTDSSLYKALRERLEAFGRLHIC